ncbi:isthmin-1 isoform X1 [Scleropages formosus]|uniref:isthmin-1 isoform X1 n=1 Tax=Scleropages formosus TaxID=113540 RepID=UPI0010FABCA0|nr:isthmin-1 isoform X1 [Scleropages formosus]
MVRLGAELALLLGLLLLTLHITVLRSSPLQQGNGTASAEQHRLNALPAQGDPHGESGSSFRPTHGDRRSAPFPHRRTQSPHSATGILQRDGPGAFLLDLHNFPDLSKTGVNGQNPNIQVTIEVVDGLEAPEPEKDLRKESKPAWAAPNWRNWWQRSSPAVAARRPEEQDYPYDGDTDDSNFLKPMEEWEQRGGGKMHTEYGPHVNGSRWGVISLRCAFLLIASTYRRTPRPPSQLKSNPRNGGSSPPGPDCTLLLRTAAKIRLNPAPGDPGARLRLFGLAVLQSGVPLRVNKNAFRNRWRVSDADARLPTVSLSNTKATACRIRTGVTKVMKTDGAMDIYVAIGDRERKGSEKNEFETLLEYRMDSAALRGGGSSFHHTAIKTENLTDVRLGPLRARPPSRQRWRIIERCCCWVLVNGLGLRVLAPRFV